MLQMRHPYRCGTKTLRLDTEKETNRDRPGVIRCTVFNEPLSSGGCHTSPHYCIKTHFEWKLLRWGEAQVLLPVFRCTHSKCLLYSGIFSVQSGQNEPEFEERGGSHQHQVVLIAFNNSRQLHRVQDGTPTGCTDRLQDAAGDGDHGKFRI